SGVGRVTVVNRTFEKAEALAQKFKGEAKSIKELQCTLLETDILISSTGSTEYVIDYELMQFVERLRKGKPLFLVDIAVPRDIDPRVEDLPNVFLYDIDDLQGIVEANLAERKQAAKQIQEMIGQEVVEFKDWVATLGVVPVISALRKKANTIQLETMKSIENKMPNLTERERKILSKHTKSIINQLLKEPILQAKEIANSPKASQKLQLYQQIFGIEDLVQEEVRAQQMKNDAAKEIVQSKLESKPNLSF